MPHTVPSETPQSRAQRIIDQKRRREQAQMHVPSTPSTYQQPAIGKVLNLMKDANLDNPQNRKAVIDLQRHYDNNENMYLFSTMMLFFKKNILGDETFHFLKNSMNIITHVSSLMGLLSDMGLMSKRNVEQYINLPALKEMNALFSLLDGDHENLSQSRFDQVIDQVKPLTEKVVEEIKQDDKSNSVAEALIRCASNHIDSEAVLRQVKAHPFPQRMAKAVIDIKQKGIKLTTQMLDQLTADDDPSALLDRFISGVQSELQKPAEESWVSKAAEWAGKGVLSALSFFAKKGEGAASQPKAAERATDRAAEADVEETPTVTVR